MRRLYMEQCTYSVVLAKGNPVVGLNSLPRIELPPTNDDLIELADLFLVRGMKGSVELVLAQTQDPS